MTRASRRPDLLTELVEVMSRDGFAGVTLDELAGQLRCSKTTLYGIAASKEQLVVKVVIEFFRRAAQRIEDKLATSSGTVERVSGYLDAVAAELGRASRSFMLDIAAFEPARQVYERNTQLAAARVRTLVEEGFAAGSIRGVDAVFVGTALTVVMKSISRGEIAATTGLTDSDAYKRLTEIVLYGIAEHRSPKRP
ncbi:MAG TPA: TetR family transcriptional regulator [Ilumatobacteraceae bacterium]|jgi:AcrR family transcriptional regulator